MKQLTCEMCGSTDLLKQDGVFVCQSCGMKYSVEEAKKMMIEGTVDVQGTVKIDKSANVEKYLVNARRAKSNSDYAAAARYYEQVLLENPDDWEAAFYVDYCTAANCVIRDIGPAAMRIKGGFNTAFTLIYNSDMENKEDLLVELYTEASNLLSTLRKSAYNHYSAHFSVDGADKEFQERARQCGLAHIAMGHLFYNIGNKRVASICYKNAQDELNFSFDHLSDELVNRIREYDPEYKSSKGGCYVATAVYGSYDCPQVWTLRRYRDYTLAETWHGRAFIKTYYAISPTLVKWFGHTEWFKKMWQGKLDRMVAKLQANGVESTPYEDRIW